MRKFIASFLLFVFIVPSVMCQEMIYPSIELEGSGDVVGYGGLVYLRAVIDKTKIPSNMSSSTYQWMVFKNGKKLEKTTFFNGKEIDNYLIWPDSTQIFFAAGMEKAKITVILDVNCLFEVKEKLSVVDSAGKVIEGAKVVNEKNVAIDSFVVSSRVGSPPPIIKEIVIGDGSLPDDNITPTPIPPTPTPTPVPVPPTPTPTPTPVPVPVPVFPEGKFGLSKISYDLAKKEVNNQDLVKAPALAASYESVADRISQSSSKKAAGIKLTSEDLSLDVQSIMTAIKESNGRALDGSSAGWSKWDSAYGDIIYRMYKEDKIYSIEDWEVAFRETALGLKEVK